MLSEQHILLVHIYLLVSDSQRHSNIHLSMDFRLIHLAVVHSTISEIVIQSLVDAEYNINEKDNFANYNSSLISVTDIYTVVMDALSGASSLFNFVMSSLVLVNLNMIYSRLSLSLLTCFSPYASIID